MSSASEISLLAKLLHQNGDKVLNSISKLSLNAVLLQKLNKKFDLLIENEIDSETSFQVISSHNGNSELVKDLHFLHDFVQKTSGLKLTITPSLSLLENKVDISKFKSVKYLEIKKIPIKEVIGLKNVQSQLESIVCIRCLTMLEELLANCGGDNSSGFVWSELREAVLSFNSIKVVDTSIAFAPWLQVLDLSHNLITDVKAIECLPNLKYVNLSFNCLDTIPTFNKSARKKIELLVLKNNYVENLSGLNDLCHLIELDLSNNLVSDSESLDFLLSLSALQWLSLAGNPISFHKNYRRSICSYLHINASFSDFYLDKVKLSKKEKAVVGIKLSSGDATVSMNHIEKLSKKTSDSKSHAENGRNMQQTSSIRKTGKGRLIVIPNLDDGTYEEEPRDLDYSYFRTSSTEHLITKKRIENTRSTYGVDNWLVQGSSVVQDILGLPTVEISNSTPFDDLCLQAALDSVKNVVTTTAVIETLSEPHLGSSVKTNKDSFLTCKETDSESQSAETSAEKEESLNKEPITVIEEPEPVKETSSDIEEIKEEEVEFDENEKLYVVSKEIKTFNQETKREELFLTITDTEIQERELTRGKIVTKWSLSLIESCVKLKPNQLQLVFGTVRRDKKERTYHLDEEEATALYKQIAEILESRTLSDMNQVVYKCENCSSQFSVEIKSRKSESNSLCPFCNSKFILQLDEVPLPSYAEEKKKNGVIGSKTDTKVSHNRSSSAGGFFQNLLSQTDDKILKCGSQSSIGSAAFLDETNELPVVHNPHVKRSDSDIEILSNPSQSSIEVLDGTGRFSGSTPLRKRSSEEKQAVAPESVAAAINLIQGNNPIGLTESSSSGSVTDSICTAYESSSGAPPGENKIEISKVVTEEESEKDNQNGLSKENSDSLLQEALKRARIDIKDKETVDIKYSFTDFTFVDHRVKVFLYTHVYEDFSEEFLFGIRGFVLPPNENSSFPSYVSVSNKKLYLLEVTNIEQGDDARNFLRKNHSFTFDLNTVNCIYALTWYQGFGLKIQLPGKELKEYLVLLKDPSRTRNFLDYLTSTEVPLLGKVQIIKETLERPYMAMQQLLLSCTTLEDSSIRYFCLLNFCSVINSKGTTEVPSGGLLTNSSELLLFEENFNWLFDNDKQPPNPAFCQKFINLIRSYTGPCKLILQFDGKKKEIWSLTTETKETADALLLAIKDSVEKLSIVPLQVSSF